MDKEWAFLRTRKGHSVALSKIDMSIRPFIFLILALRETAYSCLIVVSRHSSSYCSGLGGSVPHVRMSSMYKSEVVRVFFGFFFLVIFQKFIYEISFFNISCTLF